MITLTSTIASPPCPSNGASDSSLSPFRSFLRMLNWRRDPAVEMQIDQLRIEEERLKNETAQIEREIALLD